MEISKEEWEASVDIINEWEKAILEEEGSFWIESLLQALPFTWWVDEVDEKIGLLWLNRLVIFAWEAGSGKTTMSLQQAIANANNGKKVAYMSLEMGREWLIKTTAKKAANIDIQTKVGIMTEITPAQKLIYTQQIDIMTKNENLDIIGYQENLSLLTFEKELYKLWEEYDLVFIDNIGSIGRADGIKEIELLPKITDILMRAKLNYTVTVVALHHVNKWQENSKWPRGRSAIRGSWKVVDDADFVVMIHREKSEDWGFDSTSFLLMKDRDNGQNASVGLMYNKGTFIWDVF